jgi:ABC-type uncharacterized transport system auxiliary subunit
MDSRRFLSCGRLIVLLTLLATLATAGGCTGALATAVWLIKGPDIPAEFDGLRDKRVVVVCRPATSSMYANPNVAKEISRDVSRLLKRNISKIDVVKHGKVAEWLDTNTWDDFTEVGKALEADVVLGIDLEQFSIYEGQTLFQGKADFSIEVCDCATGEVVFEKNLPLVIYPPNHGIDTADMQECDFRREFVEVLSDQIARHFYPHDPRAYFAMDAKAMH